MPYVNPLPYGVYLDNNATMPLLPRVRESLCAALESPFDLSNPSSIHKPGQRAKELLYLAKKELSEYLGTQDTEQWIFLSGATEAINSVVKSFASSHIAYSNVDHSAVLDSVHQSKALSTFELKVGPNGQLTQESLREFDLYLEGVDRCLLNWQVVNNETGSIFDFEVLASLVRKHNQIGKQKLFVLLDAAQALGKLDESYLRKLLHLADYAAFSAHKIGAPAGIGALWMRGGVPFSALIHGGKQEKTRRAGTHNTLGILGFCAAVKDWRLKGEAYRQHMGELRSVAMKRLSSLEGFVLHGDNKGLCNTLNFHFEGCRDESLLLALDLEDFYLSSGSACNSGSLKPSRVLLSMGISESDAVSSLRMCVGPQNTLQEIELFCDRLIHRVKHIRASREKLSDLLPSMKEALS